MADSARNLGLNPLRLTSAQVKELKSYDWPGNLRESHNLIERAAILAGNGQIHLGASTLQSAQPISRKSEGKMQSTPASLEELKEQERSLTLAKTGGKIYGADGGTALLWTPANGAFLASSADGLKERLTHQQ